MLSLLNATMRLVQKQDRPMSVLPGVKYSDRYMESPLPSRNHWSWSILLRPLGYNRGQTYSAGKMISTWHVCGKQVQSFWARQTLPNSCIISKVTIPSTVAQITPGTLTALPAEVVVVRLLSLLPVVLQWAWEPISVVVFAYLR